MSTSIKAAVLELSSSLSAREVAQAVQRQLGVEVSAHYVHSIRSLAGTAPRRRQYNRSGTSYRLVPREKSCMTSQEVHEEALANAIEFLGLDRTKEILSVIEENWSDIKS